jgi:hypothetical protein
MSDTLTRKTQHNQLATSKLLLHYYTTLQKYNIPMTERRATFTHTVMLTEQRRTTSLTKQEQPRIYKVVQIWPGLIFFWKP